jgi:hypothetical protein
MYPASVWSYDSPGHDDDARVPVLQNRSVTKTLYQPRFSGTPFDCSVVTSSPQQTLVYFRLFRAYAAATAAVA